MTPTRRHSTALVLMLILAAAAALAPATGPVRVAAAQGLAPTLELVAQTPWVEAEGEWQVELHSADIGPDATIEMTLFGPVTTRQTLAETISGGDLGTFFHRVEAVRVDEVPRSDSGNLLLSIPVRDVGEFDEGRVRVREPGVMPVRIEARDAQGQPLADLITHLIRLPGDNAELDSSELLVSLVVPLHAAPALQVDGSRALEAEVVERFGDLVRELAAGPMPVTIDPTPESLVALAEGSAVGADTVGVLADMAETNQIIGAPYVELDLLSWIEAGRDSVVADTLSRGAEVTRGLTGTRPDVRTWVIDQPANTTLISRLVDLQVDQVVVDEDQLTQIPSGPIPVSTGGWFALTTDDGREVRAVATNDGLARQFLSAETPADVHRFLANMAVLQNQFSQDNRGFVFAAPDDWTPDLEALALLLQNLDGSGLVRGVTLDELFETIDRTVEPGSSPFTGPTLARDLRTAESNDLGELPTLLSEAAEEYSSYRSLLAADDPAFASLEERLLVARSADLSPSRAVAMLNAVRQEISDGLTEITLSEAAPITLTGRQGVIPLRLTNASANTVTVSVQLISDRLDFPDGETNRVELPPGDTPLDVTVRSSGSGGFPLRVVVNTPDGRIELARATYSVRSTFVPGLGIAISAAALLFLIVWWARHWRDSSRRTDLVPRAGSTDDGDDPTEPDTDDIRLTGQPTTTPPPPGPTGENPEPVEPVTVPDPGGATPARRQPRSRRAHRRPRRPRTGR
ncbi:MAG: hypothetical protein GY929_25050 [Actinomycetia bacterium]|nr:hypothetical protein [Actinomycetes bacterium]